MKFKRLKEYKSEYIVRKNKYPNEYNKVVTALFKCNCITDKHKLEIIDNGMLTSEEIKMLDVDEELIRLIFLVMDEEASRLTANVLSAAANSKSNLGATPKEIEIKRNKEALDKIANELKNSKDN